MKTFTHTLKNPARIALSVVALTTAFAAGARAGELPQVHVNYSGLDLNTPSGAATLYQRIRNAADEVCAVSGSRELARIAHERACVDHAIAEAVAAVNNPLLTGLYEVKTGATPASRLAAAR